MRGLFHIKNRGFKMDKKILSLTDKWLNALSARLVIEFNNAKDSKSRAAIMDSISEVAYVREETAKLRNDEPQEQFQLPVESKFYRLTANFPDGSVETIKTGEPMIHAHAMIDNKAILIVIAETETKFFNIFSE
jgi:hypothetical protein